VKYLILIYTNPLSRELWEQFSEKDRARGGSAYAALSEELLDSGELVVSEGLADPSLTTRVSVEDGRLVTADGPFAEAKELVAGFYLVECDSHERAVEIAAKLPDAELGLVEVRPVMSRGAVEM
jgi:hypothetical protein